MTADAGLFVAIAEIAGVFVGFGALISVTGRSDAEPAQVGAIRGLVTNGLVVVVAALIPVVLDAYGFVGRGLWLVAGLVFLLLSWAVIGLALRREENRRILRDVARRQPIASAFFWLALEAPIQVPLLLAVLGIFPEHAGAFYVTALAFNLFQAAFILAQFVYARSEAS